MFRRLGFRVQAWGCICHVRRFKAFRVSEGFVRGFLKVSQGVSSGLYRGFKGLY